MAALATTRRNDKLCSRGDGPFAQQTTVSNTQRRKSVSRRPDRQEVMQFLREAERNRRQINKLEKERTLSVQCRKNGWSDMSKELEEYERTLERERDAQKMKLRKQLGKIRNSIGKFQQHLANVKRTSEVIEKLQELMSEVEVSINAIRDEQHSRFEEYLKEERTCGQEIIAFEKKIENWSFAVTSNPKTPTNLKAKPQDRDLPAEVKALEDFLQKNGGPYGGWDQFDHETFQRVWTKHRGKPSYRKEAKLYLSDKTPEDIQQHEGWHQELLELTDKKKQAIQRWKASKQRECQTRIQQVTGQAQSKGRGAHAPADPHKTEEDGMKVTRQSGEWREEKSRKQEQEEEQKLAEEVEKKKQEEEECCQQLDLKSALGEDLRLKRGKEDEEVRRRREDEQKMMENRQREAAKDLQRAEPKSHEKQLRVKEEEDRQRLQEKRDAQVKRDPSWMTRPTQRWQEEKRDSGAAGRR